ncbi:MAG: addiction module protein, partial [Planctomycetes bacterium]|nr:addiction module protein [Planctomycetota bacterium]
WYFATGQFGKSASGHDFPSKLSEAQRQELDARLDAYHRDPGAGSPWEAVKARISLRP